MEKDTIITIVIVVSLIGGVIYGFSKLKTLTPECISWKYVTSVDSYPMANFWGKDIKFLVHYSDGSQFEHDFSPAIGSKSCTENKWEWK